MASPRDPFKVDLLPGTLDLLILKTLLLGPRHGYGIAQHLQQLSADALQVEEGSLYPALQRLRVRGFVTAAWKLSPTRRRARYYRITRTGRRQLEQEMSAFDQMVAALKSVLHPA